MSWADSIPTPPDGCDETPFLSDRKPSWPTPSLLLTQPLFSAAPALQLSESNQAKSERRCSKTYRFSLEQLPSTRREHVFFSRRAGPACEMKMSHNRTNQALFRLEPSSSSRATRGNGRPKLALIRAEPCTKSTGSKAPCFATTLPLACPTVRPDHETASLRQSIRHLRCYRRLKIRTASANTATAILILPL
jgi:hypothetical protein